MEVFMTLKRKYRRPGRLLKRQFDPPAGTRVFVTERHTSKYSGNSGKSNRAIQVRPRRKAYGPF